MSRRRSKRSNQAAAKPADAPAAAPEAPPPQDDDAATVGPRSSIAEPGVAESGLDHAFGALRFHHFMNAMIILAVGSLVYTVPELTLLPLYLAAVACVPLAHLKRAYGLSNAVAMLVVIAGAFAVLIATILAVLLPIGLQLLRLDGEQIAALKPMAEGLLAWVRNLLIGFGVDPVMLDETLGLDSEKLVKLATERAGEGAALLLAGAGVALQPLILAGLAFLVVFLAAYALAYSATLKAEARRFLRICWPERTVRLTERLVGHAQDLGAEVFRGYAFMVLVLGFFYFAVYLGALAFFPAARALPPFAVIVLIALSGLIGAIPGLGAKVLLLVGAVAGLVMGLLASIVTGSLPLGVYIFAAILLVTGFESKFGTPSTLGRALGVNSCLILYLAIAVLAGFGISAVLWSVFVILPILVAATRVMVEIHGEPEVPSG